MTRRRQGATAIASNPVLVGVATTLVIVVAVFLAYNANAGPARGCRPTALTAEVPSAANLVRGNEARIGGLRVGVIDKITPVEKEDGTYTSVLDLKLETQRAAAAGRLHADHPPALGAGPEVRPDHERARRAQGFEDGEQIPLASLREDAARSTSTSSTACSTSKTRDAAQENLRGYGSAFAGRGESINRAIEALVPLAHQRGEGVPQHHGPGTRFERFFKEQGDAAGIVAPVAEIQARSVREPRPHLHGLRRGRAALHPAEHHPGPERTRHRHRGVPEGDAVLREHRAVLHRASARLPGRCALPTRTSPTRS